MISLGYSTGVSHSGFGELCGPVVVRQSATVAVAFVSTRPNLVAYLGLAVQAVNLIIEAI